MDFPDRPRNGGAADQEGGKAGPDTPAQAPGDAESPPARERGTGAGAVETVDPTEPTPTGTTPRRK